MGKELMLIDSWWEKLALSAVVIVVAFGAHLVLTFALRRTVRALIRQRQSRDSDLGSRARNILAKASGSESERYRQRVETVGSLLRNVIGIVLLTVTALTVLAIFGVPMGPMIASAGIGGVALGFGAQSLVKDYLSGIFMLAEDQFGVGDVVQIGDIKGTVLEVTLRVTKLRDPSGVVWYLRNGEVLTVGNISQGYSASIIDIPVAIDEDPERVRCVMEEAIAGLEEESQWSDVLLESPTVLGVDSMSGGTMIMKILLKTGPDKHWGITREVRARVQQALSAAGVRGPIIPGTQAL